MSDLKDEDVQKIVNYLLTNNIKDITNAVNKENIDKENIDSTTRRNIVILQTEVLILRAKITLLETQLETAQEELASLRETTNKLSTVQNELESLREITKRLSIKSHLSSITSSSSSTPLTKE